VLQRPAGPVGGGNPRFQAGNYMPGIRRDDTPREEKKRGAAAPLPPFLRDAYSPYIFCFISRRSCASMVSVAVGLAISLWMPIGSPVSSQ
jgi:hypothetical protein